jgi:hypothetical protein
VVSYQIRFAVPVHFELLTMTEHFPYSSWDSSRSSRSVQKQLAEIPFRVFAKSIRRGRFAQSGKLFYVEFGSSHAHGLEQWGCSNDEAVIEEVHLDSFVIMNTGLEFRMCFRSCKIHLVGTSHKNLHWEQVHHVCDSDILVLFSVSQVLQ